MSDIIPWLDQYHVEVGAIGRSAVALAAAVIVIALLKRVLQSWLDSVAPRLNLSAVTASTILRSVTAVLWLITVLMIFDVWGVGLGGLWSLLVSATAVIGVGFLATWAMVSNFTASFFLTIWRPFRLGDTVVLIPEDTGGRVTSRNLMFTVLREPDGSAINIPNNLFFQKMFRVVGSDKQPSSS